jgi:hypothetical protein
LEFLGDHPELLESNGRRPSVGFEPSDSNAGGDLFDYPAHLFN